MSILDRIDFLWYGSFDVLFSCSNKKRFNYAWHVKVYMGKCDLFDLLQNLIACTRHCLLCQGVIFIQFYCTRMKVIRGNFRGKVYFIYPFVHWTCYQRDVYMRVDSFGGETHHFYVSRYIFHSFIFTVPSYLLSNLASWFSLKSDLTDGHRSCNNWWMSWCHH